MRDEIKFAGINARLSDYECKDGELYAESGMWLDEAALQGMALPGVRFTLEEGLELLGVHETSQFRHLILKEHYQGGWRLYWMDDDVTGEVTAASLAGHSVFFTPSSNIRKMAAIGNVIILLTEDGLKYLLWKADEETVPDAACAHRGAYKYLGDHLPELPIQFGLQGEVVTYPETFAETETDFVTDSDTGEISEEHRPAYTNHIKGLMNRLIADKGTNDGKFIFPFLVRYAYRLYDGETLTMHSAPVLMTPSTKMAPLLLRLWNDYSTDALCLCAAAIACKLRYKVVGAVSVLDDWKDIVQSVDIFVTPPIYTYDQGGKDMENLRGCDANVDPETGEGPGMWCGRLGFGGWTYETRYYYSVIAESGLYDKNISEFTWYWVKPPMKSDDKIAEEIRTAGDFYLLKSIKIEDLATEGMTDIDVPADYLQSLRQRERLEDDYCSHDRIIAETAFGYNNRMNFAGIQKERFGGHLLCSALQYSNQSGSHNVTASNYWKLSNQYGEKIVTFGEETYNSSVLNGGYLFYPARDCTKAIVNYGGAYKEFPMRPHDMLNGSVWFEGFAATVPVESVTEPTPTGDTREDLYDKLYTTEINNPFHIPLSGINTVPGGGKILGIASATKALSQGQFGQFPLYAFTDNGVWALEVSSGAGYSARQPTGRDVCVDGESITQTDDAVLFASGRGIMVVSGGKITCLSDKVRDALIPVEGIPDGTGLGFRDFMDGCRMVYDYAGQRLTVYHPDYDYALVYGIESGEWGGAVLGITGHVAAWPSPYVVCGREVRKLDGSEADGIVRGWLVTRPMKLRAGGDVLKTVRSVIVRGMFREGHVQVELEGSRDLFTWHRIWSSVTHRVRGYSGTPWKYFRLRLWVVTLEEDESLTGCSVDYVAKYLGKMR